MSGSPGDGFGSQDPFNDHEEVHLEEGEEPWLVSYADLMTLLFGFFAMLFTFANFETESPDYIRVKKELAKFFGYTHVTQVEGEGKGGETQGAGPKEGAGPQAADQAASGEGAKPGAGDVGAEKKASDIANMEAALQEKSGLGEMTVQQREGGITINMMNHTLFDAGGIILKEQSTSVLDALAAVVTSNKHYRVWVEGHTDDTPISTAQFASNWELSSARAGTVVRHLVKAGIPMDKIGAIGYGESRPAYPNKDTAGRPIPVNRKLNRRVVIKIAIDQTVDGGRKPSSADSEPPSD